MSYIHLTLKERAAIELFAHKGLTSREMPGSLTGIIQPFPEDCAVTVPKAAIVLKPPSGAPKRDEGCRVTTAL